MARGVFHQGMLISADKKANDEYSIPQWIRAEIGLLFIDN